MILKIVIAPGKYEKKFYERKNERKRSKNM